MSELESRFAGSDAAPSTNTVHDRSIGDIISATRNLGAAEVERVLAYQRQHNVRFGEAAVALGLASEDDVLAALAQQFHYPMGDAERRLNSPELVLLNQPFSAQAEAFRAVRTQLMMRINDSVDLEAPGSVRRALAVISPGAGDGKTFFAANMAVALAQLGGRVLLVDANLRDPRQHDVFGIKNATGLSTILSGRTDKRSVQGVPGLGSLYLMPAGPIPPNPLELLQRPAFGLLMRELIGKFDHVVVDTPAAEQGADPCVIAIRCGAAVVLARKDQARHEAIRQLVASLDGSTVQIAGAIVNTF